MPDYSPNVPDNNGGGDSNGIDLDRLGEEAERLGDWLGPIFFPNRYDDDDNGNGGNGGNGNGNGGNGYEAQEIPWIPIAAVVLGAVVLLKVL